MTRSWTGTCPKKIRILLFLVMALSAAAPGRAFAQHTGSGGSDYSFDDHRNEFGVWAGSYLGLPSALGSTRDAKFPFMAAFRYGRVLVAGKSVALEYTLDVVPVAIVTQPRFFGSSSRQTIYGAGVSPVGFKVLFRPHSRLKPFLGVSSGPFYFSSPVPRPEATRFNFYSVGDMGLQISTSSRHTFTVGYRIGHVSNAGTSDFNPGFNSSTVYAGFSVFK